MVDRSLAIFLGIIVLVLYLVVAIYLKVKPKMIAISCVFIAYLTAVVAITLFPITYDSYSNIQYDGGLTWYNFIPFKTINEKGEEGESRMFYLNATIDSPASEVNRQLNTFELRKKWDYEIDFSDW